MSSCISLTSVRRVLWSDWDTNSDQQCDTDITRHIKSSSSSAAAAAAAAGPTVSCRLRQSQHRRWLYVEHHASVLQYQLMGWVGLNENVLIIFLNYTFHYYYCGLWNRSSVTRSNAYAAWTLWHWILTTYVRRAVFVRFSLGGGQSFDWRLATIAGMEVAKLVLWNCLLN